MLKQKYEHVFTHEHVFLPPTSANTDGKKAVSEAEFSEAETTTDFQSHITAGPTTVPPLSCCWESMQIQHLLI